MPLEITLDTTQEVDLTAVPVDDNEVEVKSAEPVTFSVASGDVVLVNLSPTMTTIQSGVVGDSVIDVVGAQGSPKDQVTVHVVAVSGGEATHFQLTASGPRPKAPPTTTARAAFIKARISR